MMAQVSCSQNSKLNTGPNAEARLIQNWLSALKWVITKCQSPSGEDVITPRFRQGEERERLLL
ncbi:hypothetical protein AGR7C_Lc20094 [Agrobacterium deltaense Zutra 3/1]|uniref:Uncharacterized protein n=1 Tax=Agrobacterium deltaense Zutra 3/1 TaxID=1183427 RepID=A0A1S7RLA2_9HYPH|nr:hypothetical protein AGR7C_Lc20094 [Agrobacterium deltaense Zutra 3/1]